MQLASYDESDDRSVDEEGEEELGGIWHGELRDCVVSVVLTEFINRDLEDVVDQDDDDTCDDRERFSRSELHPCIPA